MSGHSHWATIKRKKADMDAKKSKGFAKIAQEISVATKQGGQDLQGNIRLRMAIDKAKELNMPAATIERAIKKASGQDALEILQEILVEARGPEGIALLIEGITNNKNRTIGEVRSLLEKNGGKIVEEGAMRWLFDLKGVVVITPSPSCKKEDVELIAIEKEAEDIKEEEETILIYSSPANLEQVRRAMQECQAKVEASFLEWVPKEPIEISDEINLQKLVEILEDHEDIQRVFTNAS